MKTLKLNETNNNFTTFDQCLTYDNVWVKSCIKYETTNICKLNDVSEEYIYYIFESTDGDHTLLRDKK